MNLIEMSVMRIMIMIMISDHADPCGILRTTISKHNDDEIDDLTIRILTLTNSEHDDHDYNDVDEDDDVDEQLVYMVQTGELTAVH